MTKSPYTITTNNRERELVNIDSIPESERSSFNDLSDVELQDYRFFKAYGIWFDSYEVIVAPDDLKARGWDGYLGIAYGCCYVFRYFDEFGYTRDGIVAGFALVN